MDKSVNMNLRGKRRVLLVYDVQVDYYKPSAEERRDDRERGYRTASVEENVEDSIGEIIHYFEQSIDAKVSKHSGYLIADKEGLFDSKEVEGLVLGVVRDWDEERSGKGLNRKAKGAPTDIKEDPLIASNIVIWSVCFLGLFIWLVS